MNKSVKRLALSAMFLGIGIALPFLTGQLENFGNMLLPMHLPVLLCGLVCGWQYGAGVGFVLPLLRSLIFTKPPMYPNAVVYSLELCTYGLIIGLIWSFLDKKRTGSVYIAMLSAMACGRVVWALAKIVTMGLAGGKFTFAMFLSGALFEAILGIVLQLVVIPLVMSALKRARLFPYDE